MRKVTQRQWYGGLVISFFLALLLVMNYASMVVRPVQVGMGLWEMRVGMEPWEIISMAAIAQIGYWVVWRISADLQICDLSHGVVNSINRVSVQSSEKR